MPHATAALNERWSSFRECFPPRFGHCAPRRARARCRVRHRGQESRSTRLFGTHEPSEQLRQILRGDPTTVVGNGDLDFTLTLFEADLDLRSAIAVFDGVRDEIAEHLPDAHRVGKDVIDGVALGHVNAAIAGDVPQPRDGVVHEHSHIQPFALQLEASRLEQREVE